MHHAYFSWGKPSPPPHTFLIWKICSTSDLLRAVAAPSRSPTVREGSNQRSEVRDQRSVKGKTKCGTSAFRPLTSDLRL